MKKITACIILSLLMCLSMAFPVSAADYMYSDKNSVALHIKNAENAAASTRPAGFNYRFVMLNDRAYSDRGTTYETNLKYIYLIYCDTPVINVGSTIYYTYINMSTPNSFADGNVFPSVSRTITSFSFLTSSPYPYKFYIQGTSFAREGYSIVDDLSTAKPYNLDSVLATAALSASSQNYTMNERFFDLGALVDASALQALISYAKTITDTGYSSTSWNALQSQITAAESLLATTGYTQTQVDAQTASLQAAINGLAILPNIDGLIALLAEADTITDTGYTVTSWSHFVTARSAGHALVASSSYTESAVASATIELSAAISGLAVVAVVPPPSTPKPLGYDLGTGDISGYLAPSVDIFYSYVKSMKPVLITLFSILFGIKIGPHVLRRIFKRLRR